MRYVYVPVYARNVWFSYEAEKQLEKLATKAKNPAIKKWINKTLRNYIINNAELPQLTDKNIDNYTTTNNNSGLPEWVSSKYKTEQVFVAPKEATVAIDGVSLDHLVDYLNSEISDDANSLSSGVPEVVVQVRKWDAELKAAKTKGIVPIGKYVELIKKYSDGYHWVSLKSKKAQVNEGREMGNCLQKGYYWEGTKQGSTQIYSLRDAANHPHVSIEVTNKDLRQVKGKENKVPVPKYRQYILDFINDYLIPKCHVTVDSDLDDVTKMGFLYNEASHSVIDPAHYTGPITAKVIRFIGEKNKTLQNYDIYRVYFDDCTDVDFSDSTATVYNVRYSGIKLSDTIQCMSVQMIHSTIQGVKHLISSKTGSGNHFDEACFPDLTRFTQTDSEAGLSLAGSRHFPKLFRIDSSGGVTVEDIPRLQHVAGKDLTIRGGVPLLVSVDCDSIDIRGDVNPAIDCKGKRVYIRYRKGAVTLSNVDSSTRIDVQEGALSIRQNCHVGEITRGFLSSASITLGNNCVVSNWDVEYPRGVIHFGRGVVIVKGTVYATESSEIGDNCQLNRLVLLNVGGVKLGKNIAVDELNVATIKTEADIEKIKKIQAKQLTTHNKKVFKELKDVGLDIKITADSD